MSVNGHSDWSILKGQRYKTNSHAKREKPPRFELGKYVKRLKIKYIFVEVILLTPTKERYTSIISKLILVKSLNLTFLSH